MFAIVSTPRVGEARVITESRFSSRRRVVDHVEVEEGVDTVQYVGDSGVGYSGKLR
ncbi:hypothetical protein [Natrialba swarupiae]|uniref:hypothetical protein n=1 Tax=Natrialba swarupiae TaxID=2448032 RepID=UPI001391204F|nr:hypothetical protein [Natrialba swarupiae]